MRTFWAIVAVLVLGSLVVFALARREKAAPPTPAPASSPAPAKAQAPTGTPASAQPTAGAPSASQASNELDKQLGIAPAPGPQHAGHAAGRTGVAPAPAPRPAAAAPQDPGTPVPPGTIHAPAKIGEYAVAPGAFARRADGSMLADGRFPIRGKGTKQEPYVVAWETLVSAEEAFEPAKKRLEVPQRVAMLHDTIVTLEGYVAFPLMIPQPQELLLMMNQWDGCCIGIPPTPYDAVEVRLTQPARGDDRLAFSGKVTGLFKVEPFVVKNPAGDWLMSMYTLSDATFTPAGAGPSNAGGEGEPGV